MLCYFLIRFAQIQLKMFLNNLNQTSRAAPTHLRPCDSTGSEVPSDPPLIAEKGLSVVLAPGTGILKGLAESFQTRRTGPARKHGGQHVDTAP